MIDCTRRSVVLLWASLVIAESTVVATDLNISVTSGGSGVVTVVPCGGTLAYEVRGTLGDSANLGLAGFVCDIEFAGGPMVPADAPSADPMLNFAQPAGMTGAGGFGGTVVAGGLVHVGGVQNTMNNTPADAPVPIGTVITGVAHTEQVLVTGTVLAPVEPGTYLLTLSSLVATVIVADDQATGYWQVEAAGAGSVSHLTVVVLPASPPATASNDGPACLGQNAMLLGGSDGMATYSWAGPGGYASSEQSPTLSPVVPGVYTLTVTDSNNCIGVAKTEVGLVPGACDPVIDCNFNGVHDACDISVGTSNDCNVNDVPDDCDLAGGLSTDCQPNGVLDICDIGAGSSQDCNGNALPDECDLASATSVDCNGNNIPDDCEADSDADGLIDGCDNCAQLPNPGQVDDDGNGIGDACQSCFAQLLADPGFELDGDGWNRAHFGGRSVTDSQAHSGVNALQMIGSHEYPRMVAQATFVAGGKMYQAGVWVKTQSLSDAGVTVSLVWLDKYEKVLSTDLVDGIAGTNEWTFLVGQIHAPSDAAFVRFVLFMEVEPVGNAAGAWFDGAELIEITPGCDDQDPCTDDHCEAFVGCVNAADDTDTDSDGVPDCQDVCAGYDDLVDVDADGIVDGCDSCVGQLLVTPGFETEDESWWRLGLRGRSVDSVVSNRGSRSLRMDVHDVWDRVVYQNVAVVAGTTYEAGVWVRTENVGGTGATAKFIWMDTDGETGEDISMHVLKTDVLGNLLDTHDWTLLTGHLTAPPGALAARILLYTGVDPDGEGSAWFDDTGLCAGPSNPKTVPLDAKQAEGPSEHAPNRRLGDSDVQATKLRTPVRRRVRARDRVRRP